MKRNKASVPVIDPCPRCGFDISITPQQGGRGTGELTLYVAKCSHAQCGYLKEYLGASTGRLSSAIREFNRDVRREVKVDKHKAKPFSCADGTYGVSDGYAVSYGEGFTLAQARAVASLENREVTPVDWEATRRILEKMRVRFDDDKVQAPYAEPFEVVSASADDYAKGGLVVQDANGEEICQLPDGIDKAVIDLLLASPAMRRGLTAIQARICGEWDNPALVSFGELSVSADEDILRIIEEVVGEK